MQRITFNNNDTAWNVGNTFTLTCPGGDTTAPIQWAYLDVDLEHNIDAALEAKCGPSFDTKNNQFGVDDVTFTGAFTATNVPTMVCHTVSGPGTCSVTTQTQGVATVPGVLLAGDPASATAGLEVAPDPDGGVPNDGSGEDVLYVLRRGVPKPDVNVSSSPSVQQFGPANDPGLTAPPSAADDTHGSAAALYGVGGLGLDDTTGRLFVAGFHQNPLGASRLRPR